MIEISRVILRTSSGRVLMGKRSMGRAEGYWDIPGGKIETSEAPDEAAKRETWEETGITLHDLFLILTNQSGSWLSYVFLAQVAGEIECFSPQGEHSEFRWFTPEEIEEMKENIAFDHYAILQQLFEEGK